jgi:hypothetical protein
VVKEEHKASHLIFIFTFSDERGENSPEAETNMGRGRGPPHAWRRGQIYIPSRTRGGGRSRSLGLHEREPEVHVAAKLHGEASVQEDGIIPAVLAR